MYQQITLVGNLGSKPELRHTGSGVPVASFRMAVNKVWTGNDGERHDETTWFRVTCWQKKAEVVNEYLDKGSKVLVVGEMKPSTPYQNANGEWVASLEVTALDVKFLGGGRNQDGEEGAAEPAAAPAKAPTNGRSPVSAGNKPAAKRVARDEDIPF